MLLSTILCGGVAAPVFAQATGAGTPFKNIDENGVDLTDGSYNLSITSGTIGAAEGALSLTDYFGGSSGHNLQLYFRRSEQGGTATITITFGSITEQFTAATNATSFAPAKGNGATLTKLAADHYRYIGDDGTTINFRWPTNLSYQGGLTAFCSPTNEESCSLLARSVASPSGLTLNYNWRAGENCTTTYDPIDGLPTTDCVQFYRLSSVGNNLGYRISFSYQSDSNPSSGLPPTSWRTRIGASFHNDVFGTTPATMSYAYPSGTVTELSDIAGRTWRITRDANQYITGVKRPGSSTDDIVIAQGANGVTQVVRDGVATNYSRAVSGSIATVTVTNALNQQTVVTSDLSVGRPTSVRNAFNETVRFAYDANSRPYSVTAPERNAVQYLYDARGNILQTTAVAKPGSGAASIVTSAAYPANCANAPTCNQPTSTTDAEGNVTDYAYNSTTGLVTSVTLPAPQSGAIRPQTRYSYTIVNGASLLSGISTCQTLSSCFAAADEVRTTMSPNSNGLRTGVTTANGTGTLAATTLVTYDAMGNVVTSDGPLTGTADTTRYRYDAARQVIGVVGPDPDGALTLKHRARRIGYNPDGQVTSVEIGTVTAQTDAAWSAFAPLETVISTYDGNSRKTKDALTAAGTTHAVAQYSYDALGRPDCVAQRMNPAEFASLPASACDLDTEGSYGPDRIARTLYDAVGRAVKQRSGVGTALVRDDVTLSHTLNGQVRDATDAEGNRTYYAYDGHDRRVVQYYPSKTVPGDINLDDFEYSVFDDRGNLTRLIQRDNSSLYFTYDGIGRLIFKDVPSPELDVTYAYDNLGRLTSASQTGHALNFTWDALGRNLTQVGAIGTVTSAWDIAGRRTRLTDSSGLAIDYDYHVTGEMTSIEEGTGFSLASFAYDDRGRRTSLTRGNDTTTTYTYDPISRLAELTENIGGASTTHDQTLDFTYNPASQIVTNTRSNDIYAWTGHSSVNRPYNVNGLNQYTYAGANPIAHDARGNLTSDGVRTFGYSSENLLTGASAPSTGPGQAMTLSYDPLGRLFRTAATISERRIYDGVDLIAEYDGANQPLRRFVHGPGIDEPLVEYVGTGTSTRRWLHADERGSIVALSDGSGGVVAVNRYDEYGAPASTNIGRFGYTGQAWLPEIGLYYYKARMYHPALGRFVQTDPIGYGDGMNLYAYVGNDPVNAIDPTGTADIPLPDVDDPNRIVVTADPVILVLGERYDCGGYCVTFVPDRLTFETDLGLDFLREVNNFTPGRGVPLRERRQSPCERALNRPGRIETGSAEGALILGLGFAGSVGVFRNIDTGDSGYFWSAGVGAGADLGGSFNVGIYSSLRAFVGYADNYNWSVPGVGGFATPSGSITKDLDGNVVGGTVAASRGPVALRAGASGTFTHTSLFGCSLGSGQ